MRPWSLTCIASEKGSISKWVITHSFNRHVQGFLRTLTVPCSGNFRGSNQIVIGSQVKSWNDILCCQGLFNGGYLACFGEWECSSSSECTWRLLGLHLQSHIPNCHWISLDETWNALSVRWFSCISKAWISMDIKIGLFIAPKGRHQWQ